MKVINKDPRVTIPDITERDITNKVILLDIEENFDNSYHWIYIAKKEGNNAVWYGCSMLFNIPYNRTIRVHLIDLITYIYDEYRDYIKTIYILESLQEVEDILIKLNTTGKLSNGLRTAIIQYSNEIFPGGISIADN